MIEHPKGIVAVRITPLKRSSSPENYYREISATYYARHLHESAKWGGHFAEEKLKLKGIVEPEDFASVLRNQRPGNTTSITPRTKVKRSAGYDMTFHVPKSVSVMALVAGDARIIRAFVRARNVTLSLAETYAETRVRRAKPAKTNETRSTGNLLYATFLDSTARPVRGSEADPHLHSHVVVMNATWDAKEDRWKALQGFPLKSAAPMLQAVFQTDFANRLRKLGYSLRWNGPRFEIDGVSTGIVDCYSKRAGTINQVAEAHDIFLADELGELGAKTRHPKGPEKSWAELVANWRGQLTTDENMALDQVRRAAEEPGLEVAPQPVTPSGAVEGAVGQLVEHAWCWSRSTAIVETLYAGQGFVTMVDAATEIDLAAAAAGKHASKLLQLARRPGLGYSRDFLAQLLHSKQGFVSKVDLDQEVANVKAKGVPNALEHVDQTHPLLVGFTTERTFRCASACMRLAAENKGKQAPLGPKFRVKEMFGDYQKLAFEQTRAIRRLLKSRDFVVALKAPAGRGRTALLRSIAAKVESQRPVFAIAGNAQSCALLAIDGFSGAPLVGNFLRDYYHANVPPNSTLIIDEAGTVGSEDMLRLLEFGKEGAHRIVLVGGMVTKSAIWNTDSLRLFAKNADLNVFAVGKVVIEKSAPSAEQTEAGGRVSGTIITQPNLAQRTADAAAKIVEFVIRKQPFLAFALSTSDAEMLTRAVRDSLFEMPRKRITVERWAPKPISLALLSPGDIVELIRDSELGGRGEFLRASRAGDEINLRAISDNSLRKASSEVTPEMIKVFEPIQLEMQIGDRIRIGRSTFSGPRLLIPGDIVEIADIDGERIATKGGNLIPADFRHLSYGWVTTPDAVTSDSRAKNVLIFHSRECGELATLADQIAGCTARGGKEVWLFADDVREMVRRSRPLPMLAPTIDIFESPQAPTVNQSTVAGPSIAQKPVLSATSHWEGPAWFKVEFFVREQNGNALGPILGRDMAWQLDFGAIAPDALVARHSKDGDWKRADEDRDLKTYCSEVGSRAPIQSSEQEPLRPMTETPPVAINKGTEMHPKPVTGPVGEKQSPFALVESDPSALSTGNNPPASVADREKISKPSTQVTSVAPQAAVRLESIEIPEPLTPKGAIEVISKAPAEQQSQGEPQKIGQPQQQDEKPQAKSIKGAPELSPKPPLGTRSPEVSQKSKSETTTKKVSVPFGRYRKGVDPIKPEDAWEFFVVKRGKAQDPISMAALRTEITNKTIGPDTLIRRKGGGMVLNPAGMFTELIPLLLQAGHDVSSLPSGDGIPL